MKMRRDVMIIKDSYTVKEVAEILGVCIKTIYYAIQKKEIKSIKIGKCIRISRQTLLKMLEG